MPLAAAGLLLFTACSAGPRPVWTRGQAEGLLREALESPLPDQRRGAVQRISASRYAGDPICIEALAVILRTDDSMLVRRAAARGLARSASPAAAEPLVSVIAAPPRGTPPDAALRRDVIDALAELAAAGALGPQEERCVSPAAAVLGNDPDREVRMAAARLLGRLRHPRAVEALIEAVGQADFGVSCTAHRALMERTGQTHGRDAAAWRAWWSAAADSGAAGPAAGSPTTGLQQRTTAHPAGAR